MNFRKIDAKNREQDTCKWLSLRNAHEKMNYFFLNRKNRLFSLEISNKNKGHKFMRCQLEVKYQIQTKWNHQGIVKCDIQYQPAWIMIMSCSWLKLMRLCYNNLFRQAETYYQIKYKDFVKDYIGS